MIDPRVSFQELIADLSGIVISPEKTNDLFVTGISLDSRQVLPGNIFVALSGGQTDGHQFIQSAIQSGAVAVIGSQVLADLAVPYLQVKDTRLALAQLSSAFYGHPARKMTIIGVTGTDGKTTTTNLIHSILKTAGFKAGMVSTVNAIIGEEVIDTGFHVTTPEAPMVQHLLARMLQEGITHVVLEATSHGLDQKRVSECEFDLAVITNITHEHLDYHGNYQKYLESKGQLIRELARTGIKEKGNLRLAVMNYDDISYPPLQKLFDDKSLSTIKKVAYSCKESTDFYATDISTSSEGIAFNIHFKNDQRPIKSLMIGAYNVANILAAFSACVEGLGISPDNAARGIALMPPVPGRGERIESGQNFIAIVDFAHTPNALKVSLENARKLTSGRLIAVFGSAGLRDRAKRRMMAETSIQLADMTFLTAEDPRTERLDDILAEMADAARKHGGEEGKNFLCVPDRGEAIRQATQMAEKGDLVIACGKGHEQSMCFGTTEYPWDDRIAMKSALEERLGIEGPKMPYLPTQEK
jgi:UDP-N-acetylmuramoyl-L-alanyl-D-glutamate--2,6-diaminopimelate ligase